MIKLLITDIDGSITDGKINISNKGEIFKSFNVKDGMGIKILQHINVETIFITARSSEINVLRANELGVQVFQSIKDKLEFIIDYIYKKNISLREVAYFGDDVNDLECIKNIEISGCPFDAIADVKNCAFYNCNTIAGNGALREYIDYLIRGGYFENKS